MSNKTQPRDPVTKRFIKAETASNMMETRETSIGVTGAGEYIQFPLPKTYSTETIRLVPEGPLARFRRSTWEYRSEIAFVGICLIAGLIGGYLGVKIGLN